MGNSSGNMPQVLLVGSEGAGKTTLIYGERSEEPKPTQGYNREERNFLDKDPSSRPVMVWDLSGKEALKPLWSSYYKNIYFSGVIFAIDSKSGDLNIEESVRNLHYLTNEEELRDSTFLVLFNMKNSNQNSKGRKSKDLEQIIKREEIHRNTRINYFEFDFKGYDETTNEAFKWFYLNLQL